MANRRDFIRTAALGTAGLLSSAPLSNSFATNVLHLTDKSDKLNYGGIYCPANKTVHGRVGDAIYPFFYLADKTGDSKYIDSAMLLYRWMESRVSQLDGSWLNEPVSGINRKICFGREQVNGLPAQIDHKALIR